MDRKTDGDHRSQNLSSAALFYRNLDVLPRLSEEEEESLARRMDSARMDLIRAILAIPAGSELLRAPLLLLASGSPADGEVVDAAHWSLRDGVLPPAKRAGFLALLEGFRSDDLDEDSARGLRLNWQWIEELGEGLFSAAGHFCALSDMLDRFTGLTGFTPERILEGALSFESAGSLPGRSDSRCWSLYPELICIRAGMESLQARSGDTGDALAAACAAWRSARKRLDSVLEALVESNLRLVLSVARRFPVSTVMEEMDLIQEGCSGLMHAARRFDFQRGFRFSTYAVWWIRRYISSAVTRDRTQTGTPPFLQKQMTSVRTTVDDYAALHGRHPTPSEIAEELGIPESQVDAILCAESGQLSMDHGYGDGDGISLGDSLETAMDSPEKAAWREDLESRLGRALDSLPQRERSIICLRFGLFDGEPRSLESVSRIFGVSRERIRQIQSRTLARLRDLGVDLPRGYEEEQG